ncbi:MAG: PP2C family protein-serine/threonine phosphatase [bacterium]
MTPKFIETAEVSLQGGRRNNQDRCAVLSEGGSTMLVVADGLGGHPKGEVAAQIMVNVCQQLFARIMKPIRSPEQLMKACMLQAHKAILEYGARQKPPISPRTTAVLAILQEGMCYWMHVGDSRLYLIRDNQVLVQTRDHSVAEMGSSLNDLASNINPNAITRCLGGDPNPPNASMGVPTSLQAGDYVLICTDGFWSPLPIKVIVAGLKTVSSLHIAVSRLAAAATRVGGENSDNATAVVAHLPPAANSENEETVQPFDQDLDVAVDKLQNLITRDKKKP